MESLLKKIIRVAISNIGAILVFILMLKVGFTYDIPLVKEYWVFPAIALGLYLIYDDFNILTSRA